MKKIKVKVTGFWQSDECMLDMIKVYGLNCVTWKNIEFTLGEYDRLIILTRPYRDNLEYDERKAITFLTEPISSHNNRSHKTSYVAPLSLVGWTITKKSNEFLTAKKLTSFRKTKLLSSVISDLCYMEGHLARLGFLHYFDQTVREGFDLWGKNTRNAFFQRIRSYKGSIEDKFDALLKYKYHFNCENSFNKNYYTEKLIDPILTETLCFYDGCSNISSFIDERAYIKLDVRNIEESINTIVETIELNQWKQRLPYIRKQKERLLTQLNPLNIIWMAVNEKDILKECTL